MDNSKSYSKYLIIVAFIAAFSAMLVYKYVSQDSPAANPGSSQSKPTVNASSNNDGIPGPEQYFNVDPRQPVWLLFISTSCGPCVALQKTMAELQPEFAGKVQFVAIDVNDPASRTVNSKYKIIYVPTSYLFDSNQNVWAQISGAPSTDEMRDMLNQLAEAQ